MTILLCEKRIEQAPEHDVQYVIRDLNFYVHLDDLCVVDEDKKNMISALRHLEHIYTCRDAELDARTMFEIRECTVEEQQLREKLKHRLHNVLDALAEVSDSVLRTIMNDEQSIMVFITIATHGAHTALGVITNRNINVVIDTETKMITNEHTLSSPVDRDPVRLYNKYVSYVRILTNYCARLTK